MEEKMSTVDTTEYIAKALERYCRHVLGLKNINIVPKKLPELSEIVEQVEKAAGKKNAKGEEEDIEEGVSITHHIVLDLFKNTEEIDSNDEARKKLLQLNYLVNHEFGYRCHLYINGSFDKDYKFLKKIGLQLNSFGSEISNVELSIL